tara:strand:- start:1087 stop:1422 length:336 start_codon:yes stop_codon:yes gene_type:complete
MLPEGYVPINLFEKLYGINEKGDVWSVRKNRSVRADFSNPHGYPRHTLYGDIKKRFLTHRLVAEHHHDEWDPDKVVDHIDGDKTRPHADNLEQITQSDNTLRAIALGLRKY